MKKTLLILATLPFILHSQDKAPTPVRVTHGPVLGRPATDSMSLWVRTERSGKVNVFYGTAKDQLTESASIETTDIKRDYTGIITLKGLKANTRYYYRIEDHQLEGSFLTMPQAADFKNAKGNPKGLFNFKFEFACGNNQGGGGDSAGPTVPVFKTLNAKVRENINFAILNGDWLYEQRRDYPPKDWLGQVGLNSMEKAPRIVQKAPTVVGVWENYKTYLARGRNLSEWHRHVPSFYTADDHEALISRHKDFHDSSVPSGNSMAATALLRLGKLTANHQYLQAAEGTLQAAATVLLQAPAAAGQMLIALDFWLAEVPEDLRRRAGPGEAGPIFGADPHPRAQRPRGTEGQAIQQLVRNV